MSKAVWVLVAILVPGMTLADPVNSKAAKKMLFSPRGQEVVLTADPALSETEQAYVKALAETSEFASSIGYYGAMAISPSFFKRLAADGNAAGFSGLFQITAKYHSPGAAANAALAACNKARKSRDATCVIALRVLPKRWKARPLSLSVDATLAFRAYRKGKGARALAMSAATEAYAIAKGEGAGEAALAACNAAAVKSGSPDCEVMVAD